MLRTDEYKRCMKMSQGHFITASKTAHKHLKDCPWILTRCMQQVRYLNRAVHPAPIADKNSTHVGEPHIIISHT